MVGRPLIFTHLNKNAMAELKSCVQTLASNILNDCNDVYGVGVENRAWILPKSNLDYTINRASMTIDMMALSDSAVMGHYIYFPAEDAANGLKVEDQNATIGTRYTKTSPLVLLANNPRNALAVQALKSDKYVVVFELRAKDQNQPAFIVMGAEMGCVGQDANWDAYSEDTQGGWAINMVEKNATLPMVFFDNGSIESSREALESMVAASAATE